MLKYDGAFLDSIRLINGGMAVDEPIFLHFLAQAVPDSATVTNVGVWHGSSAIVLLDALSSKRITFNFIDCFDIAGISVMSAQPAVTREQFIKQIRPYIRPQHTVNVVRANTLELEQFPKSDFVFLDAGHTKECVANDARLVRECMTSRGVAAFHDYGYPDWPDVKPELDAVFPGLQAFQTVAVFRVTDVPREAYHWPNRKVSAIATLA